MAPLEPLVGAPVASIGSLFGTLVASVESIVTLKEPIQSLVGKSKPQFEPLHYWLKGDMDKKGAKNWQK